MTKTEANKLFLQALRTVGTSFPEYHAELEMVHGDSKSRIIAVFGVSKLQVDAISKCIFELDWRMFGQSCYAILPRIIDQDLTARRYPQFLPFKETLDDSTYGDAKNVSYDNIQCSSTPEPPAADEELRTAA